MSTVLATRAGCVAALVALAGCATGPAGPPLADPLALARRAAAETGGDAPTRIRFAWRYGDRRGDVEGEGVARFNPPDSLRLDLFTSGDVALAVAATGERVTVLGELDDVELPPRPLVFAMTGRFRPPVNAAPAGFAAGRDSVLVYARPDGVETRFFLRAGRLQRAEERRHGRVERFVRIEWPERGAWPSSAEYRDLERPSRTVWRLSEVRAPVSHHPPGIYDLPVEP
ncbi:MAG: hypothetical protein RRA92_09630 [Gemmatimonadota bacterium]|nr:hypothetical protein [Gemmatimonadota bacterium]